VADADSSRDQPGVGPWRISQYPLHAPGAPRLTSTELTGPVAEGGTGSSKQDLNPPQGAYTRRGPRSRAEYPNHVEPHGRHYARPIRHSVDRKVALNRNYCRSVTIQTLGLKAIYLGFTSSNSRCTATLAGFQTLIQTWHGPDRVVRPLFDQGAGGRSPGFPLLAMALGDPAHSLRKSLNRFGPRSSDLAASSSHRRPASVILILPTAITLPVSLCAVASPARTSLASIGRVKPWTCMIASVAPNGLQASNRSARHCSPPRRTFSRPHGDCVRHRSIAGKAPPVRAGQVRGGKS